MKPTAPLITALNIIASRRVAPLVLGTFALLYVALAFRTDDALVALLEQVKGSRFLLAFLALAPGSILARLAVEAGAFVRRHRALRETAGVSLAGLFAEEVTLPKDADLSGAEKLLRSADYRIATSPGRLVARRGMSGFPARAFFLIGAAALFLGIILSVAGREVVREALIEGEPVPEFAAGGGIVGDIALRERPGGLVLARALAVEITRPDGHGAEFGLYPPGRLGGWFIYPRFLGVAPRIRFSAPDLRPGIDTYSILMVHPPGREDALVIPNTPYRLLFSLDSGPRSPVPGPRLDPYVSGAFVFHVRVEKGGASAVEITVPAGGEAGRDGYMVAIPEVKRMVATDFIRDRGVPLIWLSFLLFGAAFLCWLPVRLLAPRREILIIVGGGEVRAFSRAEGGGRSHAGVFHEVLDRLG